MELFNLLRGETKAVDTPEGWHSARVHLGGDLMGMSVYDLAPGEKTWPYHFELAEEEWIVVVEGEVTLRTPDGARSLRAGDVAAFPVGPAGAHGVRNDGSATARYLMLSTVAQDADGAVYPDSGTFVVRTEGWSHRGRLGEAVPYWEGEP